jgi:hypothetical protein
VRSPTITSPSSPDLETIRAYLRDMLAAARFAELIAAILALIGRMHAINLDLVKQIANHRRARPSSEKLARLERQLSLPLAGLKGHPLMHPLIFPRRRR